MVFTSSAVNLGSGSGSFTPLYEKLRDITFASIMTWHFSLLSCPPVPADLQFAVADRIDWALFLLWSAWRLECPAWTWSGQTLVSAELLSLFDERPSPPHPFPPSLRPGCSRGARVNPRSWPDVCPVPHPIPQAIPCSLAAWLVPDLLSPWPLWGSRSLSVFPQSARP